MKTCANCEIVLTEDMLYYELSNLCEELSSGLEMVIKRESNSDYLCEECFNFTSVQVKTENISDEGDIEDDLCETEESEQNIGNKSNKRSSNTKTIRRKPKKKKVESSDDTDSEEDSDDSSSGESGKQKYFYKGEPNSDSEWVPPGGLVTRDGEANGDSDWVPPGGSVAKDEECKKLITIPNYRLATATHSYCFVRGCDSKYRKCIPFYLQRVLLERYNFFVPYGARGCTEHVREYYRDWSFLSIKNYKNKFSSKNITQMLDLLRENFVTFKNND